MEDILYGISAFRYHRTPSQVRALLPCIPQKESDKRREAFKKHPLVCEITGLPAHLMVRSRSEMTGARSVKSHLMTGSLPFGSVKETEFGLSVSSPLLTLLQLAQSVSEIHLVMAMYEMCGSFAVFKPSAAIEEMLAQEGSVFQLADSWRRVCSQNGRPSDLWQRPPLVSIEELNNFAYEVKERRKGAKFLEAAKLVTGITASPFEAQLSILLSFPRRKGGEEIRCFENNKRIALSRKASLISGKNSCYADLLFEERVHGRPVIVECQGAIAHGSEKSLMSDSDRTMALQEMGYDVLPLTYGQIVNPRNFDIFRRLLFKRLGLRYRDKTPEALMQEHELRRNLFIDWSTLGT